MNFVDYSFQKSITVCLGGNFFWLFFLNENAGAGSLLWLNTN